MSIIIPHVYLQWMVKVKSISYNYNNPFNESRPPTWHSLRSLPDLSCTPSFRLVRALRSPLSGATATISMASPSSWGRSPIVAGTGAAAAVQASLTLPTTSSPLSVLQTKKIKRLRIRSSYGCPPEKNPPNSEPLVWLEKGSKTLPLSIPRSGDFVSVIRKLSSDLGIKYFRKRPLWKRIFFASKKVRSLILLNVLTVIYGNYLLFSFSCFWYFS